LHDGGSRGAPLHFPHFRHQRNIYLAHPPQLDWLGRRADVALGHWRLADAVGYLERRCFRTPLCYGLDRRTGAIVVFGSAILYARDVPMPTGVVEDGTMVPLIEKGK